jgi:hypothetical protein
MTVPVVTVVTSWGAIGRDPALRGAGARFRGVARNVHLLAGAVPPPLPSAGRRASSVVGPEHAAGWARR